MQTVQTRRSRMKRKRSGKRIELSARDIEIFKLLYRYRYLRSTFLHAFIRGSENRFKERIGDLYHEGGFINRPKAQWQYANARYMPVIYELDTPGLEVLKTTGHLHAFEQSPFIPRTGTHKQFAHAVMICDILASVELGTLHSGNLQYISSQDILVKAPDHTKRSMKPFSMPVTISHTSKRSGLSQQVKTAVVPDAVFGLEYADSSNQKSYRFFALEADRNTMPVKRSNLNQSSYVKKLLAYREIMSRKIYASQLGLPNLMLLTVTNNERHTRNIMQTLLELSGTGSKRFLFKTMHTLGDFQKAPEPTPHMLTEAWQRTGHEPLCIDRP